MTYKGYKIYAEKEFWIIWKGDFTLSDYKTIDGDTFQSDKHAYNDAKKNIDTIERLNT